VKANSSDYTVPKFCSHCGVALGDPVAIHGEPTWECSNCRHRHYRRPTVGVAVVLVENGKVLLVQRRFGGRAGKWCIPCGHVEWGEEIRQAAQRELLEETGLVVEIDEIIDAHTNFWRPERLTVGVWFAGHRVAGELRAGDDAAAVEFFDLDDLPDLAFPTDQLVLELMRIRRTG
jgi:8-oxo-dGTP diphosphatase